MSRSACFIQAILLGIGLMMGTAAADQKAKMTLPDLRNLHGITITRDETVGGYREGYDLLIFCVATRGMAYHLAPLRKPRVKDDANLPPLISFRCWHDGGTFGCSIVDGKLTLLNLTIEDLVEKCQEWSGQSEWHYFHLDPLILKEGVVSPVPFKGADYLPILQQRYDIAKGRLALANWLRRQGYSLP